MIYADLYVAVPQHHVKFSEQFSWPLTCSGGSTLQGIVPYFMPWFGDTGGNIVHICFMMAVTLDMSGPLTTSPHVDIGKCNSLRAWGHSEVTSRLFQGQSTRNHPLFHTKPILSPQQQTQEYTHPGDLSQVLVTRRRGAQGWDRSHNKSTCWYWQWRHIASMLK